ncbi:hypothetical protein LAZ67_17001565 [Cordylochernes scorpioides]|uniref:Reverse transcriptase Ty1/copia-type domain-containing protein n=1 Tax=Cordylochernes scorpioides TaxID=51811 RepID=A0ABY6LIC0_9ARAC|nr:hypothetical protein LAZ67_17001565 [Cordylochernes scorpioides]
MQFDNYPDATISDIRRIFELHQERNKNNKDEKFIHFKKNSSDSNRERNPKCFICQKDVSFIEKEKGAELLSNEVKPELPDHVLIDLNFCHKNGQKEEEPIPIHQGNVPESTEPDEDKNVYNLRPTPEQGFYYESSLSDEDTSQDDTTSDPTYHPTDSVMKVDSLPIIPTNYEEAINSPDKEKWLQAMRGEIVSLKTHKVWDVLPITKTIKPIKSKWVFSIKNSHDPLNTICKARLVAVGCTQKLGLDYSETYSPVIKSDSLRTLIAFAVMKNLHIHHFDIETAFLYGKWVINNPENEQVNMLVYCMGDNADDILLSCKIASDQLEKYEVIKCFESHFIPRRNIIYERARFNQRCQQEGERVNDFITALHSLAEHCNFGALYDELIRDRIVVGVRDRALSERMQLDTDLTLVKATQMAKQSESVKEQHCGNANSHDWKNCPAMNSYCNKCKRKGHYAKVCRSVAINEVKSEITFLGSVEIESSKKWVVPIKVNNRQINFKIDTGADVNVLPFQQYCQSFQRIKLEKSDKILQGPNGIPLKTVGMIHVILQNKGQHLNSKIYIVDKLKQPLLSRETSEKLNIVRMIQQLSPKHEALMPSEFPIRPWQKVGMDLFYLNGRWYLIVCDYYSRYPEISLLQNLTAQEVINRLKSIFARHGTPETEAIMDPNSKRTSVPAIESSLMPRYLDSKALQEREKRRMINQKRLYDKRHDVHSLPQLQQGDSVWIRDQRVEGKVLHKSQEPRSYWVQTSQGKVRRNRLHLTRLPTTESTMDAPEDSRRQELRNEEAPPFDINRASKEMQGKPGPGDRGGLPDIKNLTYKRRKDAK